MTNVTNIIADIGGTNIRIAQLKNIEFTKQPENKLAPELDHVEVYQCNNFTSLAEVLRHYVAEKKLQNNKINACLAIACPVDQDFIKMTNLSWSFSLQELKQALAFEHVWLINDYAAIAYAVTALNDQQKVKIGKGEAVATKPIAICGPGTGLGVASLIHQQGKYTCISGEGGHVDFAPLDHEQVALLTFLQQRHQHVSYEQLLSGLGLEQIYMALLANEKLSQPLLTAQQITDAAIKGENKLAEKALDHFCNILGAFAGNLALTLGAMGGVYIAGGIVPRFIDYFKQSDFRKYFELKGRFANYNRNIPTYVITAPQPGLLGASVYLCQQLSLLKKHEEL